MRLIFGVLAVAGCSTDPPSAGRTCDDLLAGDLPSCDVADACRGEDTGDAPDRADCVERFGGSPACDPDWRAGEEGTSQDGLLYAGELPILVRNSDASVFTFTDADSFDAWRDEFDAWQAESGVALHAWPEVDFDDHIVFVVQLYRNATCGLTLARHGAWSSADGAEPSEVYVEIEDSSGSCGAVCQQSARLGVVYAVERARGWPEACATVVNRCDG
jgi:hypothetical protein